MNAHNYYNPNEEIKFKLHCDGYVDQNRYIGLDPVGYKCMNEAGFQHPDGFLICQSCVDKGDSRVEFRRPFGPEYQRSVLESVIQSELNRIVKKAKK